MTEWAPFSDYSRSSIAYQPQPFFSSIERRLLELRERLDSERQYQLDRRRVRRQEVVDKEMVELTVRQLQRQTIPITQPDPVPKRTWVKAKAHGRADARGLTTKELVRRRQRQQARREADEDRIAQAQFIQQLHQAANNDTQLSTITVAPIRPRTPISRSSTPTPSS